MTFNSTDLSLAQRLDDQDSLKNFRNEFVHSDENLIYLDGNSLGRLPLKTKEYIDKVVNHQWGERLIRSWNEGWYELSKKVGGKISKIIGAKEDEVIISDSTSVNLYKLVTAALNYKSERYKIISDEFNFPSDLYVIQGITEQYGNKHELKLIKSGNGITIDTADVEKMIDEETAVVVLSHAAFKSSFLYDMKEVTKIAHDNGALMLWDLSHSAGAVDVELNDSNADLAIGCTYKYLNGGPGSPAFLYVRKDLHEKLSSPVWGWFGDAKPFDFSLEYEKAQGINKFLVGTPPVISLSAVDSSIDIIHDAGIKNIREKSVKQTEYLVYLIEKLLMLLGFSLGSPIDANQRGSHVSIKHPEAYRIVKAMTDEKNDMIVIPDFREQDNIRLGVSPLYNSFEDIWRAVQVIKDIIEEKRYLNYKMDKSLVT